MALATTHLTLSEQCRQVVLLTTVDAISATYAYALATSPFVPQNCRVVVWDVSPTAASDASQEGASAESAPSSDASATTPTPRVSLSASWSPVRGPAAFATTMEKIEANVRERRAPRPTANATHMTQLFYGDVSPKMEEIQAMLQRVDVCHSPRADVSAALTAGALAADSSVFILVLNAQSLGTDTAAALKPYETFVRAVWGAHPHQTAATSASPSPSNSPPLTRQGSLVVLADEVYRAAACAMVKTVAAEVSTTVDWLVLLAYVHALDPPALEFGATEVAVGACTGLSHGGTLPVLCAANALGVLRHFPVSRSEPATVTPIDVAVNAALLGHIFLRCGELPACIDGSSDAVTGQTTSATPENSLNAGVVAPPARYRMASFAVAESHKRAEASLVWGMFGEYLMGYYGRFAEHIGAAFPVAGVVAAAPILQFPFNVMDIANFGPEPRCPTYLLEGWRAYQQRQRVVNDFHGAQMTRKMQACVQQLDDTLASITSAAHAAAARGREAAAAAAPLTRASATSSFALPPYYLGDFNVAAYQYVLRRLTTHYSLMPYHQCVALSQVDWEAYISVIAKTVLVHLASCVLQRATESSPHVGRRGGAAKPDIAAIAGVKRPASVTPATAAGAQGSDAAGNLVTLPSDAAATVPFGFPEPRRSFTNDFIFCGDGRIPPFPSLTRQYFTSATFLHRTALRSNGWRSDMTPGMCHKTLTAILAQPHIQQLMTALAAKDGVPKADVEAQAKRILLIAGDTLNHLQCRTMGLMVHEFFKRVYHRVNVNHGAFERLQRQLQMPRVALVFVPLHRSYVDFLIMSYFLAEMQSSLPHMVAGDGFLNMGPVATLMRGSGAFFVRRTFRGDPLYSALFKECVRQIMLSHRPLGFFMEGTRSRTGKTMAPKMGILKFACDTFFDPSQQELDDVFFIPLSLSYDELLEAAMYAKELLGVPKPKENFANLLKASSILKRKHGSIHIHMGDPISLRSLKEHPQQCPLPYQPKNELPDVEQGGQTPRGGDATQAFVSAAGQRTREGKLPPRTLSPLNTTPTITKLCSPTPTSILSSVAWHLTYQLQRNVVITPASIVAALLEGLSPYYSIKAPRVGSKSMDGDSTSAGPTEAASSSSSSAPVDAELSASEAAGVPLHVMEQSAVWLRGILIERGARLTVEAATWSADHVVKTALDNLHCFVHLTNNLSTVSYQNADSVVCQLGVNISTNQLIHVCIDEALVVVVAEAIGTPTTPHYPPTVERATVCGARVVKSEQLANQTQLLQRLLSTEFPNYAASSPVSFNSWLECTVNRLQQHQPPVTSAAPAAQPAPASAGEAAAPRSDGSLTSLPVTQYYYFLLQLICPYLEALYVVILASLTLLRAYPGMPLGATDVVNTTQKVCRALYEERQLHYTVAANKETLMHYYESLMSLSLLQLGHVSPPPSHGATAHAKERRAPSRGTVAYTVGALGQEEVLERLDILALQVQKFLWYPGVEAGGAVDANAVKRRLLQVYKEVTRPSKM